MKRLALLFFLWPLLLFGNGFDREYNDYAAILQKYTDEGLVCYGALKCNLCPLQAFLQEAGAVDYADFFRWNQDDQAAFLINVYNAEAIYLVAPCYPIWSIRQRGTVFQNIFDVSVVCLFGRKMSLNQIRCMVSRVYRDARVYFALSPATLGGAALRSEPYIGSKLDEQLEEQTAQFMSHRAKNYLEKCVCSVYVSPIFMWYKCEFDRQYGSIWCFIRPYFREEWCTEVFCPCWELHCSRYDWAINDLCSCLGRAYAGENAEFDARLANPEEESCTDY
jgi:Protein of unknown function, DUF547